MKIEIATRYGTLTLMEEGVWVCVDKKIEETANILFPIDEIGPEESQPFELLAERVATYFEGSVTYAEHEESIPDLEY